MTFRILKEINIPFSGFYESMYSAEIDRYSEQHGEHHYSLESESLPDEMRVTADQFAEAVSAAMDYDVACRNVAKSYMHAYDYVVSEAIGLKLGLKWKAMESPREYNFSTDRIFCDVTMTVVRKLFAMSKRDGHKTLGDVIAKRFTSYDGFNSFYSNDLDSWLAKPVMDWDHNELGTLLVACHKLSDGYDSDWKMSVYYSATDDGCYQEIESAVNWTKYEAKIADIRADLSADFAEANPDFEPPLPRCEITRDMFTGREGR